MNKIDKLKQYELIVLDEIDRICKKYNIKYYLAYGTALGAIRHKGFIPWDDDIDLHMLSNDIEKFKQACQKELSKDYYYQDKLTDKYYYNFWPKVGLENTTWMPKDKIVNCKYGICVDIFPMFPAKDNKKDIKKVENYIKLLRITSSKYYVLNANKIYYSKTKKFIHTIIPHKLNNLLYKFALSKLNKNKNNFDKIIMYDVTLDQNICFEKNDIIGNKTLVFENRKLPIVKNLDKYLKTHYGDYMTPPEESKRYGHDKGDEIIYDFKNSYRKYLGDKID